MLCIGVLYLKYGGQRPPMPSPLWGEGTQLVSHGPFCGSEKFCGSVKVRRGGGLLPLPRGERDGVRGLRPRGLCLAMRNLAADQPAMTAQAFAREFMKPVRCK